MTFEKRLSQLFLLILAELSFTSRLALLKAPVQPCSSSQPFEFKLRGEFSLFESAYMRHTARFPQEKGRKVSGLGGSFWILSSRIVFTV